MRSLPLLPLLLLLAVSAAAQTPGSDPSAVVEVVLDDGTRFTGVVVSETADAIVLDTGAAHVTIEKARIRRRGPFAGRVVDGRILRDDPNRSRLLFAPTARAVGSGNGYVAVYEIFFPFVAVGVGDAVTLAGGISLFPTTELQLLYAAPKATLLDGERGQLAVGAVGVLPIGVDGGGSGAGLVYGVGTLGAPHGAVSLGAGYGVAFGEVGDGGAGVLLAGGETQLSNHVKLLSENYVIATPRTTYVCPADGPCGDVSDGTDVTVLFSGGVRFFGESLAADLALFTSPDLIREDVPFFPWVGFAYNF